MWRRPTFSAGGAAPAHRLAANLGTWQTNRTELQVQGEMQPPQRPRRCLAFTHHQPRNQPSCLFNSRLCVASESSSLRFAQIKQVTSNISMPPAIDFGTLGPGIRRFFFRRYFLIIEILQLAIARTVLFSSVVASDGIFTPCLLNDLHCFVYFIFSVKRSIRSAPFVTVPVTVRLKPISARHGTWSSGLYYVDTIR